MHNHSFLKIISFALLVFSNATTLAAEKSHWAYTGHEGPKHWGELSSEYVLCKTGTQQSPVNITGAVESDLPAIEFSYMPAGLDVINNGHTIQVNYPAGSSMIINGKRYQLLQFHFHSPSEHQVNGKAAVMVAHLVHKADDGQLGVIGILMQKGRQNDELARIWKHMPKQTGSHVRADEQISVERLLPADRAYFNYAGSLTTPPCSEGVNWLVLKTPVEVSAEQVKAFNSVFAHSIRPVQPLNGRVIKSGG